MRIPFVGFGPAPSAGQPRAPRARRGHRFRWPLPAFRQCLLEGVLDLLAGLLEVGSRLVALALSLEIRVVGRTSDAFLDLAGRLFGGVTDLVVEPHSHSSLLLGNMCCRHPARGVWECSES